MPLDINLFRDDATLRLLHESQKRRYQPPSTVDDVMLADQAWRRKQYLAETTKKGVNDCSKIISDKKKRKEPDGEDAPFPPQIREQMHEGKFDRESLESLSVTQLKNLSKAITAYVATLQEEAAAAEQLRDRLLVSVGNVVHESVPVEQDEEKGNTVVRTFGECVRSPKHKLIHVDIMEKLGLDCGKSVTSMSGGRAFVLRGALVSLQMALISYGMAFLTARGYTPFYPPFFMTRAAVEGVAQLSDFDDQLYKVVGEGEDKYLIATSEMPIAAYHSAKWFQELPAPIKYCGVSSCFRKEVGSHGRDTRGIFRVHQFDKLEQFVVCSPRDNASWALLEEMIGTSEDFYKSLGLPYRVVNICSGALNNAAAKKYDLEGWFPASGAFRELVSCSNCTDYQSRAIDCRYGPNLRQTSPNAPKEYVHMLNGTLCAVTRTLCCIAENYQDEEGIVVPEVLRPFMLGTERIRYEDGAKLPQ